MSVDHASSISVAGEPGGNAGQWIWYRSMTLSFMRVEAGLALEAHRIARERVGHTLVTPADQPHLVNT